MTAAQLIAKLEREFLETEANYTPDQLAFRRGWNARTKALVADLRTEMGLAEAANAPRAFEGEAP
jgi:hypothetical protein